MRSNINKLIGLQVEIEIGEPWEISVALEHLTIKAIIEKVIDSNMQLKLHYPIIIREKLCSYLIAEKRYSKDNIDDLLSRKKLTAGMTPVFMEDAENADPFKLASRYRGVHLIGMILVTDKA